MSDAMIDYNAALDVEFHEVVHSRDPNHRRLVSES